MSKIDFVPKTDEEKEISKIILPEEDEELIKKVEEYNLAHKQESTVVGVKYKNGPIKEETQKMVSILASPLSITPDVAKGAAVLMVNPNAPEDEMGVLKDSLAWRQAKRLRQTIEYRKKLAAMMCNVTAEQILGATAMRAFADPQDAFDDDGNFDFKKACETGAIYNIKKFKKYRDKNGNDNFEVEFYSQESAQDKLGNYLGLEKAPVQSNDESSLKQGIEQIAQNIAKIEGRSEVTGDDRLTALEKVVAWAKASKARYSDNTIEKVVNEIKQKATGG